MPLTAFSVEDTTVNKIRQPWSLTPTGLWRIARHVCRQWHWGLVMAAADGVSGEEAPKSEFRQRGKGGFLEESPLRKC